jgi:hypothetical protein
VIETGPLFIAAVLNKINSACVTPYTHPQSKAFVSKCSLPPFAMKRHTHHTSVPNKLNLYIAPFSVRVALCRTALFSDAAKIDINSKIIKLYPPLKKSP